MTSVGKVVAIALPLTCVAECRDMGTHVSQPTTVLLAPQVEVESFVELGLLLVTLDKPKNILSKLSYDLAPSSTESLRFNASGASEASCPQ